MKQHSLGKLLSRIVLATALVGTVSATDAQTPYQTSADFTKYAMKLRESAILHMEPQVVIPTMSRTMTVSGKYPWRTGIVTTVFWVGEPAGGNNPVHNFSSSWDLNWEQSYGGFDNPNPASRRNFIPANFVPKQNPFYIALPYNDVTHGTTKPESKVVIPWFRDEFRQEGQSVCHDHWIAIRNNSGKVCYAQWSDCGPFRTDHWQYVFGNERPRPNLNGGAGLDVSPAVRDYLQLSSTDVTDWKFVDALEVPNGPWALYGDNNTVAQNIRRGQTRMAMSAPTRSYSQPSDPAPPQAPAPQTPPPPAPAKQQEGPTIITHQAQ